MGEDGALARVRPIHENGFSISVKDPVRIIPYVGTADPSVSFERNVGAGNIDAIFDVPVTPTTETELDSILHFSLTIDWHEISTHDYVAGTPVMASHDRFRITTGALAGTFLIRNAADNALYFVKMYVQGFDGSTFGNSLVTKERAIEFYEAHDIEMNQFYALGARAQSFPGQHVDMRGAGRIPIWSETEYFPSTMFENAETRFDFMRFMINSFR